MNILSCGAGMQSTALALISCDQTRSKVVHPQVPRYDAIIYCDLGCEPAWVADQVRFIERACVDCNIPFRFLYKGIIIKHNKTEPTYTKTSLFLCEKRRFFMARTEKGVVATI